MRRNTDALPSPPPWRAGKSMTCSQLSITSRIFPAADRARQAAAASEISLLHQAEGQERSHWIAVVTKPLSDSVARSTHHTSPSKSGTNAWAISSASLVLPIPPGPVSVTIR